MELIVKRAMGGLWEGELTHPILCKTELLNWAKPNGYILIQFMELALHH